MNTTNRLGPHAPETQKVLDAGLHERAADLPPELAQWRDAAPDSPFPPNS